MAIRTRITDMLGIEKPIVQAAMGWIARAQLSSAVSNAGGLGIIETSSGELDAVKAEIVKMRELTDKPFGVNIAQAFVRDPGIVQWVIDQGVKCVTTSAGDPFKFTTTLKAAGLTVFHVVPNLAGALRAVEAGVDGLSVEGADPAGVRAGECSRDRRWRHHGWTHDGGSLRARSRRHLDGNAHPVVHGKPGSPQLEGCDRQRRGD
jgi:enoyl-[acyl-carrier protein] reductase II